MAFCIRLTEHKKLNGCFVIVRCSSSICPSILHSSHQQLLPVTSETIGWNFIKHHRNDAWMDPFNFMQKSCCIGNKNKNKILLDKYYYWNELAQTIIGWPLYQDCLKYSNQSYSQDLNPLQFCLTVPIKVLDVLHILRQTKTYCKPSHIGRHWDNCNSIWKENKIYNNIHKPGGNVHLTLKTPITTAADDKFCDIFPNFWMK